jgi:hypothetical protein
MLSTIGSGNARSIGGRLLGFLVGVLTALAPIATSAVAAPGKVALVIGNGAYAETSQLANPPNDAGDIARALDALGFRVITVVDGDKLTMERAIRSFGELLDGADAGLLFYAGHGLQVNGRNYLVPTNARLEREQDVPFETIDMELPLGQMNQSGARVKIVVLDACRNNPLARNLVRSISSGGRSTEVGSGLAKMDSAAGTLIAYATAPGAVAADGTGRNSPFTAALLDWVARPGLEIRAMFGRVREAVYAATKEQQLPWVNEALLGEFYFHPKDGGATPAPYAAAAAPAAPADHEALFWQSIQDSGRPEDFEEYLTRFPDGTFIGLARRRLGTLPQKRTAAVAPPSIESVHMAPAMGFHGVYDGLVSEDGESEPVRTTLRRTGDRVEGEYRYGDGRGRIDGRVDGAVLRFEWREDDERGRGIMTLAPDGQTFTGTWGYGGSHDGGGIWHGRRVPG